MSAFAQYFLKVGVTRTNLIIFYKENSLYVSVKNIFSDFYILIGFLLYFFSAVLWLFVLSKFNLSKASEECQELALALLQKLNKTDKTPDQAIIDEIGDVEIRLNILKRIYPVELIEKRIDEKLSKFESYIDHEKYKLI